MSRVRTMVCVLAAVTLIVPLLSGSPASAQNLGIIVTFRGLNLNNPLDLSLALTAVAASGATVEYHLQFINAISVILPSTDPTGEVTLQLLQDALKRLGLPSAEISKNPIGWLDPITPTDPPGEERLEWNVDRIDPPWLQPRWADLQGGGVRVAVLDTGINSHKDLLVEEGYNALSGGGSGKNTDGHGHGTHIAGIIGAKMDGYGVIGVAPRAAVVPVKVLGDDGSGSLSELLNGMQWLYVWENIRLANMSIQFKADYPPLREAIKRLYGKGVIMVAAAGNRCSSGPPDEGGGDEGGEGLTICDPSQGDVTFPAAYYNWVIPVAATDYYNQVTRYSRSGKPMADGGVVAPGGSQATGIRILSTNRGGSYAYGSGTSQAAAHVCGILALALELDQGLSFREAVAVVRGTARDLKQPAERQGTGLSIASEVAEELDR